MVRQPDVIASANVPSLALIHDFPEEGWPSMDLAAEMLLKSLQTRFGARVNSRRVCPGFTTRAGRIPFLGRSRLAFNADRLANRFFDFPRYLRDRLYEFDLFHICDHSYAHLALNLPAERTGVYLHDLDTFACLLEPSRSPAPRWFKIFVRRILQGLQGAAVVFHSTHLIRERIIELGLLDQNRLRYCPYGVAEEFSSPTPASSAPIREIADDTAKGPFLLHVGSCIPRKRIDVLLEVFARVRCYFPEYKLIQVGGRWTQSQRRQVSRLGLEGAITQLQGIDRQVLAALYRNAGVVLVTSEAEGFALPIIEALACGSVVVATDLPVLREVGADVCTYCELANVHEWSATICAILSSPGLAHGRTNRIARARLYSWDAHASGILDSYQRLVAKRCAA